jgi:hypothetical protein
MAGFKNHEISKYSNEVVATIIKNKGEVKAFNGEIYTIDMGPKSKFAAFKKLVDEYDFDEAKKFAANKYNQFEILEPDLSIRELHPKNTKKGDKWDELSWTEIEKKVFSIKGPKIETAEQEKITLKIIEYVLGSNSKSWRSFDELFDTVDEINEIFPELKKLDDWMSNYRLQFEDIKKKANLANDSYNVYLYSGEGSFMKYISDLVTKDMDLYSQKDSWNPADIWLIKSKGQEKIWKDKFNAIAKELKTGKDAKGRVGQYTEDSYLAIQHINLLLQKAHKDRDIVGLSLKKSDGKTLNYTEFNLEATASEQDLPQIKFNGIKLDCSYDKKNHKFKSKTSYVYVKDGNDDAYKLAYKSNTGTSVPGNITYEFLPSDKASAQLGKVPKDELTKWLTEQVDLYKGPDRTVKGRIEVRMPQWKLLPQYWSADDLALRKKKVALIIKEFGHWLEVDVPALNNYIDNLADSYLHSKSDIGVTVANAAMMQMVDFTWILAKLQEQKKLTNFITLNFYFAQKKGIKYNFGPFGKVY